MPFPLLAALPAAIAGGASLIGGALANSANKKQAQAQMDFQERMSNTSYQRATDDMRMAGINPMLAYQQGGASSPGGASAQMEDVVSPAVSSALHVGRLKSELESMAQSRAMERTLGNATLARTESETSLNNQHGFESFQRGAEIAARVRNIDSSTAKNVLELPGLRNQANFEKSGFGKFKPYGDMGTNYISRLLFPALGAAGAVKYFSAPRPGGASSAVDAGRYTGYQFKERFDRSTGEVRPYFITPGRK